MISSWLMGFGFVFHRRFTEGNNALKATVWTLPHAYGSIAL
jgi:hypothetical protein